MSDNNYDSLAPKLKMIDLFAGTGAFSYAFEKTGKVECVYANDMCAESKEIYDLNHNIQLTLGDLNDIDVTTIPTHDILCGGFPCQPFSIAGAQKGFNDSRSNVFWKILEIIQHHSPRIVLLENVKNLKSHDKGNTFKTIYDELSKLGYHIKYEVLNTCEVSSVPQNRERIYIACFRDLNDHNSFSFQFNSPQRRKISDCLEKNVSKNYYYSIKFKVWPEIEKSVTKLVTDDVIYQYRRYYVRENTSGVCPTLTANMGSGGHNVPLIKESAGIRKLTPRECFNLQGFPQSYQLPDCSDSKLYKLAGNAVSVPVVEAIANNIIQ